MKASASLDDILNVGYFLNRLSILDVRFTNLVPQDKLAPPIKTGDPLFISIFNGKPTMIAYAIFNVFFNVGNILNIYEI